MRDPKRIPEVLDVVRQAWETVPDWRLGQLICNIGRQMGHWDPFFMEDDDLLKFLTEEREDSHEA